MKQETDVFRDSLLPLGGTEEYVTAHSQDSCWLQSRGPLMHVLFLPSSPVLGPRGFRPCLSSPGEM